ncbi:MAE_28990/MAE_18760 family HEPN-like nuclease [Sphingobium sp. CFD-2]|uniref:MAE_28990/MAE_18760 family HEPN-like nuclease n=1 Tax=Sphingobium sp. CFD-2 TaxID=2878542 RepID=UPI00214ACC4A|nr:MAE_28990/MAE_18760 family HEPN-like nuclease [Sphingobium sp. CFD-2]
MKSPLDLITDDLSWREAELGSLKLLLARKDVSDHQKVVLLRVSWALLYAHYEGFSKAALTVFYDYAKAAVANCGLLPVRTRIFALGKKIKKLKGLSAEPLLLEMENFNTSFYTPAPDFPEVDTKSNLWPNVLEDLLKDADIELISLEENRVKIKTLVQRRNNIAHGKRDIVTEISYYRGFENAVYDVMYEMALKIDERLNAAPYV